MGRLMVFPGESEMAGGGCGILWLPFKGLHGQIVASPATSKDILPSLQRSWHWMPALQVTT